LVKGGGGGGGRSSGGSAFAAGAGKVGQVRLTYSTGGPPAGLSVNFGTSFTDQFGTTIPEGISYTDPADALTYSMQVRHVQSYPSQTINTTGFTNVTGTTIAIGARHYRARAVVIFGENASASAPQFQWACPATTGDSSITNKYFKNVAAGTTAMRNNVFTTSVTAITTGAGLTMTGQGQTLESEIDFTASASGNLILQAATGIAADTFTINSVTIYLMPVTN